MDVVVRPAERADLDQVQAIFEHYVFNTVNTFLVQKPPADYTSSKFDGVRKRNLPYLVAVDQARDTVVGYSYASGFRGSLGYGHSVEISVFCHPDYKSRGIGSKLMARLLEELKHARHVTCEEGHEDNATEFQVRKLIAIMAVDDEAPNGGLALRDWYINKWGFEDVGRLKGVGCKKGRV